MNERPGVAEAMRFFKLDLSALTVFHDELDLPPMKVKVKRGGGHAGHNGLRSIDQHLGADFRRIRLGIGHPGHKDRVSPYVLGNYAKSRNRPIWPTCWARWRRSRLAGARRGCAFHE
jgi:PTH1 family peptidyl-tRNA hydrolase